MGSVVHLNALTEVIKKYEEILMNKGGLFTVHIHKPILENDSDVSRYFMLELSRKQMSVKRAFEPKNGLWGTLLADRLQRVCDVVGRGFSGYTSRACRIILPRLFSTENISEIKGFVICIGANDSNDAKSKTNQHVPLDEYCKNLENMVQYLLEIGLSKDKIILMTPPPYCHEKYAAYCQENGRETPLKVNKVVAKYAESCVQVAQKSEIDVINLYQEMIKNENWPSYLIDGLHFSLAGSTLVYALLWPHIAKRVDTTKLIFPLWNEIDLLHPEKDLSIQN